jgi:hypothetical protein
MQVVNKRLSLAALTSVFLTFSSLPAMASTTDEALPEIQDSRTLTSKPVASGTLKDENGAPVAEGSLVVLYAWPNTEFLASMEINESAKLVPVAKAYTGAGGQFDIRVGDPNLLDPLKSADGQVELMLQSEATSNLYTYNFSRRLEGAEASIVFKDPSTPARAPHPKSGTTPPKTDGTLAEPSQPVSDETDTVAVDLQPIETGSLSSSETNAAAATDGSAPYSDKVCQLYKGANYPPAWVTVGQSYVANTGVWSDFNYTAGANSSLGVGVSASGAYGSWSSGGTASVSSQGSIDFPRQGRYTYKRMRTQFIYARFLNECSYSSGYVYQRTYQVRPVSWAGGSQVVESGYMPASNYCSSYAAGSKFSKTSTAAITWSDGAALGSSIGVNLSAQTGYSSSARAYFDFVSTRKLCGSHGYPGGTPVFLTVR